MTGIMDLKKLWQNTIKEIRPQMTNATFSMFFKPTVLLSLEDNIATIATQNNLAINILQKRFQTIIADVLKKQTNNKEDIDVLFIHKVIHTKKEPQEQDQGPLFSTNPQPFTPTAKPVGHLPRVRSDFTFANLAVSESNRLAYVSAQ